MSSLAPGREAPLTAVDAARQLRRAVIASTVGTTIEWYDFFLYSIVTGLVFAKLFFPKSDPLTGTLEAFAIYAVGFIARPIGAAIFGHYGDRIGRKSTLIATLMLMGLATFAVAFVPTYESIGIWGAVILTVLRFIQGVGVGGEWGGSVLLSMEWTRTNAHRGFAASWPQFGVPAGLFLANLVVLASSAISGTAFLTWGWRIPFALSIVLVAIPCPAFVSFFSIRVVGHVSDRIGRRRMYLAGALVTLLFGFAYFGMLNSGSMGWMFVAVILSLVPHDMMCGPQAALIAEAFTPRLRYSGASLGYQLASIIAGGPAPLIAAALFAHYNTGYAIAWYIASCGVLSIVATVLLPDYTNRDVSREYDEPVVRGAAPA